MHGARGGDRPRSRRRERRNILRTAARGDTMAWRWAAQAGQGPYFPRAWSVFATDA